MGNDSTNGDQENEEDQENSSKNKTLQIREFNRRKSTEGLIFFASTDKARV